MPPPISPGSRQWARLLLEGVRGGAVTWAKILLQSDLSTHSADWAAHFSSYEASPNVVLAGPASGFPAIPTFRGLVDADIPAAIMRDAEHTAVGDTSPHHAAVTLAADAGAILGLTGQELTLDSQNANIVLAGPATGAAADPTFRALVMADLPAQLKTVWLPPVGTMIEAGGIARSTDNPGIRLQDAKYHSFLATWLVPSDFVSMVSITFIVFPKGTGDLRRGIKVVSVIAGEDADAWTQTDADVVVAVTAEQVKEFPTTVAALPAISPGDYLIMQFARSAHEAADTVNADCYGIGTKLVYA